MPERGKRQVWSICYLLLGAAIVAAILIIGITVWPVVTPNQIGT